MLKLSNVSKYYRSEESVVQALYRVNLTLERGEFVVITGESGSGKSTLLNVVSGLDAYEEGEMFINDKPTAHYTSEDWETYRKNMIGFIFQNYNIIDAYTVYQNVYAALVIQGVDESVRSTRAKELIKRVGLEKQMHQKSSHLSGGQKQRVSIARALAKDTPIIVADEPTGNLDQTSSAQIIELLKEISEDKLVIVVTHSFDEVKEHATRRIRLFDGQISEDKTVKPHKLVDKHIEIFDHNMTMKDRFNLALKNLFSMPKKTIFMLIVSLFIVLVFSVTYGSYVRQTHTTSEMAYWNEQVSNTSESRLIITRRDQQPFTEDELVMFGQHLRVTNIVTHDVMFDYNLRLQGNYWDRPILQHAGSIDARDLREGRMPTNKNELVISNSQDYEIGERLELTVSEDRWFDESLGTETFTVVGLYNDPNNSRMSFYAHETFFTDETRITRSYLKYYNLSLMYEGEEGYFEQGVSSYDYVIDNDVPVGQIKMREETFDYIKNFQFDNMTDEDMFALEFDLYAVHPVTREKESVSVRISDDFSFNELDYRYYFIALNEETLASLLSIDESVQMSVIVHDRYDAYAVMSDFDELTYAFIYPSDFETGNEIFEAISNLFLGFLSVMLLVLMYFVAYLLMRTMMFSRQKDFLIFRSIGANRSDLKFMIIFEVWLVMMLALIGVFALLTLNTIITTPVPNYLRYFNIYNYFFMVIALSLLSILLALRFNTKLFRRTVITSMRSE